VGQGEDHDREEVVEGRDEAYDHGGDAQGLVVVRKGVDHHREADEDEVAAEGRLRNHAPAGGRRAEGEEEGPDPGGQGHE